MTQRERRAMISRDHERRAECAKAEAALVGPQDPRYAGMMARVGLHVIQANLWRVAARQCREKVDA